VRVPFGRQRLGGYVVGLTDQAPAVKLRAIEDLLLDEPVFGAAELALAERIAAAYFCPLASALRLILPPGAARKPEQLIVLPHPLPPLLAGEGVEKKRGARQGAVVQALVAAGGEVERRTLERAADLGAGAAGVLRGLEERGLIRIQRRLRRSGAGPLSRRAVRLRIPSGVAQASKPAAAEGEAGLEACATPEAAAEALERTAPRQAAILRELAGRGPLPLAELPRASVLGLEERGLVDVYDQPQRRKPADQSYELPAARPVPTPAQAAALDRVETALERHEYWGALLHGVTGSGKTEVYLGALERALAQGRGAIVLVPEISLTPQTVGRFAARFGDRIAVLHSSLGAGERFDEWERARTGEARVVIGARSALFAPVADLGIIVVDEEHEPSYKQDAVPRYNAISVAQWRAEQAGAVLLLGSATPALEHYWAACNPADSQVVPDLRLTLLELPERIGGRPLPEVRTLDLRGETAIGPNSTLAEDLREAIAERLERGEQVMLFLNRRGYSTFVMCRECGFVLTCPDCAVALIYHRESGTMRCHHCDHAQLAPEECPNCQGVDIGFRGLGTERVADQIGRQFPDHPILRLDKDTTAAKGAYGQILGQFARGEAQILIGTQMIAKGHDFPEVTLVGVINADVGLYRPDFRAAERTFQLLTQVSGRAGRADKLGQVYVQTYNPDHYALQAAAQHDYAAFYQVEIAARREHQYPPFTKLASVVFSHPVEETAHEAARQAAVSLQDLGLEHSHGAVQFVGPGACPLHKLRGRYRYQILLKAPDYATLTRLLRDLLDRLERPEDLRVTVDVDPADMM
jgi:primosomal protein N' (replication factor Y)